VVIEAADEATRSSVLSLRATVVHFEPGREQNQNGVGVVFIEDPDPGRRAIKRLDDFEPANIVKRAGCARSRDDEPQEPK